MAYRGLLVDYGGVLTTDLFESFSAFCATAGLKPDALVARVRDDAECRRLIVELETGRLEEAEFEPAFAARLGVEPTALIDSLFAASRADEAMLEAVRRARAAGIRTGLLSNSWGTRRYDRGRLGELFDAVVISGEEGLRKPDHAIYELAAERIGVAAEECVFVDDLRFNLAPAEALGMATVHHTDSAVTIAELERLLGVALLTPQFPAG